MKLCSKLFWVSLLGFALLPTIAVRDTQLLSIASRKILDEPMFERPIGNHSFHIGREAVLGCSVVNLGKHKVGWLRAEDQTVLTMHERAVLGARYSVSMDAPRTWQLRIRPLRADDRGCYMCQINTQPSMKWQIGCIDVYVPPDIINEETSADVAAQELDNVTLVCRATGHPPPKITWRREDHEPILLKRGGRDFYRVESYVGSSLPLWRVDRRQMGAFLCIASNDVPPAVSKRITLLVNFPPTVIVPNQLLGAPLGTDVMLECTIEAHPNTINYWLKNRGEMLLDGPKYEIYEERSSYKVQMKLTIRSFARGDIGTYNCVSTNSLGKSEGTLRLYEIKLYPSSQSSAEAEVGASHRAAKDFKNLWKATKKLDVKPGRPVSVAGISRPEEIANLFVEHFSVQSPLGAPAPRPQVADEEACCDADLFRFSAKQVASVIKKMTRGKSPGHDGLSIEHLQHAGVHLPRVLGMFFSLCMGHSHLPQELMRTIVVPIIKNKTGDAADKNNYRPISLATILAKVLDSLLDRVLENYLHLHDAQFGFQPGLSTESAILSLKHTVQYYTERQTPIYASFLDLSKAFDLVSYDVLWAKMRERGLPVELLGIFQYWYLNQINTVRWDDKMSKPYRLECGVRQGGITSPKLFNLYVNDLIVELSSKRLGCRVDDVSVNNISCADDMVLLSPTIRALRELLRTCEEYTRKHGLAYNAKKSVYMVFGAVGGRCPDTTPAIMLNGVQLERVREFKYLGHMVTDDLKDHADIERERRALAVRCNMLARRFARCSKETKITLFKSYCQIFYTCSLWTNFTQKTFSALRVQYNNGFRMLMGLPRFCSASGMFAVACTDDFYAIVRKRAASLLCRVRASSNSILKTIAARYDSPVMRHLTRVLVAYKG